MSDSTTASAAPGTGRHRDHSEAAHYTRILIEHSQESIDAADARIPRHSAAHREVSA